MRSYSNFSLRDLLDAFCRNGSRPGRRRCRGADGSDWCLLLLMAAGIRASRPASRLIEELAESTDRLRSLRPAIAALSIATPRRTRRSSPRFGCRLHDEETEVRQRTAVRVSDARGDRCRRSKQCEPVVTRFAKLRSSPRTASEARAAMSPSLSSCCARPSAAPRSPSRRTLGRSRIWSISASGAGPSGSNWMHESAADAELGLSRIWTSRLSRPPIFGPADSRHCRTACPPTSVSTLNEYRTGYCVAGERTRSAAYKTLRLSGGQPAS